jgi:hypothetical protein
MSDQPGKAGDGWVSRLRDRSAERRAIRADRRARRKARVGVSPGDTVDQANASNFQGGGYFTTKTRDRP